VYLERITAEKDRLVFRLRETDISSVRLTEYTPVLKESTIVSEHMLPVENGVFSLARYDGAHDRLYSRYSAYTGGEASDGAAFVTDFTPDVPENKDPFPAFSTKKTLYGTDEDIKELGLCQTLMNISLPAIMTTVPGNNSLPFEHDGKTYYFIKSEIDKIDGELTRVHNFGLSVTLILLNSPRLFGSKQEKALLDECIHPGFDWEYQSAFISAFDVETLSGIGYYRAFVEFLVSRYTKPGAPFACVVGAIISNEVNSQYVWGNAGEMPVSEYAREYAMALRQAWLAGKKHQAAFRVYASFDQHWHGSVHNLRQPLRYYEGRKLIDHLNSIIQAEGDFPWCVAYHPYPEDLRWPDFWHDRAPDFTFSTPKITFKNMEVLEAYLSQPHYLYRNEPRRIIFSEQGFNSHSGALQSLTEKMAEAGYVLAYMKARNMKTVDMFMHHSYIDNPREFGLNLGIRRYDETAPHHAGEKKPIYYAVRDMDTEQEPERIQRARAFIGDELFDYLLHPPIRLGDRDTSKDGDFGG